MSKKQSGNQGQDSAIAAAKLALLGVISAAIITGLFLLLNTFLNSKLIKPSLGCNAPEISVPNRIEAGKKVEASFIGNNPSIQSPIFTWNANYGEIFHHGDDKTIKNNRVNSRKVDYVTPSEPTTDTIYVAVSSEIFFKQYCHSVEILSAFSSSNTQIQPSPLPLPSTFSASPINKEDPIEFVKRYWNLIEQGTFDKSFGMLSPDFKRNVVCSSNKRVCSHDKNEQFRQYEDFWDTHKAEFDDKSVRLQQFSF
jgi:hypothetical protein